MKNLIVLFCLSLSLLLFSPSCTKEGPGGKAAIKGYVKHHNAPIPGAKVYIKYGSKDFPGNDITYYDAEVVANGQAYYEIVDLKKGDYYLFGVGFDSSITQQVTGGVPVEIVKKTETVTTDVPVTEP